MFSTIALIYRDTGLRMLTITLFLTGFAGAATLPFFSIVATRELGLPDPMLSALLIASSVAGLLTGVGLSVMSDIVRDRRLLIMAAAIAGTLGFGLIYAGLGIHVFLFCSVTLLPLSGANYTLVFGALRARTDQFEPGLSGPLNSTVRAVFSASWILVPGAVALLLANSPSMLPAWGIAAAASLAIAILMAVFMPPMKRREVAPSEKIRFFSSLRQLITPPLLARMGAIGLIEGSNALSMTVLPLIIVTRIGGNTADVGLITGITAAMEIPFMLMWGGLLKRYPVAKVLMAGGAVYLAFLLLLGFATARWQIYLLTVPSACGAAAIISLPMTYYQDLLSGRPGLGAALGQISHFITVSLAAAVFAIGATWFGYSATALLGAAMATGGIIALMALERGRAAGHSAARPS